MRNLPVHFDELVELLRTCISLHPDECTPAGLRDHMVARLARSAPTLSGKVRAFNDDQMADLCGYVRQGHELSGDADHWAADPAAR